MNLYFRLIWLLLRLPWLSKQTDPLQVSTLTGRVMPNDLDLNLHVNNGRYLTLMDLGRLKLMSVTGLLKHLRKNRWLPVISSAKIHFIRSLKLFDQFTLTTQVIYWDDKWIYLEQKIFKKDILCTTAMFKTAAATKAGKIPSAQLLGTFPKPPSKPPLPEALKYWLEAEKASKDTDDL